MELVKIEDIDQLSSVMKKLINTSFDNIITIPFTEMHGKYIKDVRLYKETHDNREEFFFGTYVELDEKLIPIKTVQFTPNELNDINNNKIKF